MLPHDLSRQACCIFAHPDDETLALGGKLQCLPPSDIVLVTDGAPPWVDHPEGVAAMRRSEAMQALAASGVSHRLHWLGLNDQQVAVRISDLIVALKRFIAPHPILFTHALENGHPDHDAVCLAVHLTAHQCKHPGPVFECPLYHAHEDRLVITDFEPGSIGLDEWQRRRKRIMLTHYHSQRDFLRLFPVKHETYRPIALRTCATIPARPSYPAAVPSSMTPTLWTSLRERFATIAP